MRGAQPQTSAQIARQAPARSPAPSGAAAVWWPATIVGALLVGVIAWQLLIPRPYYTGSNSVGVTSIVATVQPGQTLCVPNLDLPADTGAVRLALFAPRTVIRAKLELKTSGGTITSDASALTGPGSRANFDATIPPRAGAPASVPASLCLSPLNGPVNVGGTGGLEYGQNPASIGRTSVPNRVAVWFLPPGKAERSFLESASTIFRRAALFRPGIVGVWTYPTLMFIVLPSTWLLSILLLTRAATGRQLTVASRRLQSGILIATVAFLNAGSWALITPAFFSPDEPDHFAYVQYFAETGHMPSKIPSAQPAYSLEQTLALNAVDIYSVINDSTARPPWLHLNELQWEHLRAGISHPSDDGGGYTPGASGHDPPYYALTAAAYQLVRSQSVFSQLTMARLVSALLGALVAACAFGIVRELLPRQRVAAVAAGLLVAFQPMFGFIAGAVNNDNGVNAAAALSLYLLVRALRRGLSWHLALCLGVTLAITPLMKETGYEIYPAVAVGLVGVAWRSRRRTSLQPWGFFVAGLGAIAGGWLLLKRSIVDAFGGSGGISSSISATSSVSQAFHMPGRFLVYLWELFLPRLPFMGELFPQGWPFYQIYVLRGWGAFGWYTYVFARWVYLAIVVTMASVGLFALCAAWRYREVTRKLGWELLVIVLFPVCVLVAVEAAFFAPNGGRTVVAEQGRYIFPAIAALAVIAVGGTFGLGRRWHVPIATGLVVAMMGLSYAAQLLTLSSFFT